MIVSLEIGTHDELMQMLISIYQTDVRMKVGVRNVTRLAYLDPQVSPWTG